MNFSEFFSIIHPIIGGGHSTSSSARSLFDAILGESGEGVISGYKESSFKSYANGTTSITQIAKAVSPHVDAMEFEDYINNFGDSATIRLSEAFKPHIPDITSMNVGEKLAELFVSIIETAASTKRKSPSTASPKSKVKEDGEGRKIDVKPLDIDRLVLETLMHMPAKERGEALEEIVNYGRKEKAPDVSDAVGDTATAGVSVVQTGTNNYNVNNQNGATVNFNITYPQTRVANAAEAMMAIQSFSTEYYQLLVTCEDDVFEKNMLTIPTSRALTKCGVPEEIFQRCSTLSHEGVAELKTFPAIICKENTELKCVTDPRQFAVFGYIKAVKKIGKSIQVVFEPLATFQQLKLCDQRVAVCFDLNMACSITDLNRSEWTVHRVNVFDAFDEAGITGIPRPTKGEN